MGQDLLPSLGMDISPPAKLKLRLGSDLHLTFFSPHLFKDPFLATAMFFSPHLFKDPSLATASFIAGNLSLSASSFPSWLSFTFLPLLRLNL